MKKLVLLLALIAIASSEDFTCSGYTGGDKTCFKDSIWGCISYSNPITCSACSPGLLLADNACGYDVTYAGFEYAQTIYNTEEYNCLAFKYYIDETTVPWTELSCIDSNK